MFVAVARRRKSGRRSCHQKSTGKRVASIGDGGNDVSMIQAADVGLGLEGKEGRQASLAADFSLVQFSQRRQIILVARKEQLQTYSQIIAIRNSSRFHHCRHASSLFFPFLLLLRFPLPGVADHWIRHDLYNGPGLSFGLRS